MSTPTTCPHCGAPILTERQFQCGTFREEQYIKYPETACWKRQITALQSEIAGLREELKNTRKHLADANRGAAVNARVSFLLGQRMTVMEIALESEGTESSLAALQESRRIARGNEPDRYTALQQTLAAERARAEALIEALGMREPCSILTMLEVMADGLDHMFEVHQCDADGWEAWNEVRKTARVSIDRIGKALAGEGGPQQ